jgi:hypothetical protein
MCQFDTSKSSHDRRKLKQGIEKLTERPARKFLYKAKQLMTQSILRYEILTKKCFSNDNKLATNATFLCRETISLEESSAKGKVHLSMECVSMKQKHCCCAVMQCLHGMYA